MCDIADGRCDVWVSRWLRARKSHECMACGERVLPAETYHKVNWVFDGGAGTYKHCPRCWTMYSTLVDEARGRGDFDVYVSPWLDCGELYEGAEPGMSALAFMTRAEGQQAAFLAIQAGDG